MQYQVEKEKNDQLTGNVSVDTDPESLLKIELSETVAEEETDAVTGFSSKEGSPTKSLSPVKKMMNKTDPPHSPAASRSLMSSPIKSLDVAQCSILDHSEGPDMEISITSGFNLPEDSSPRKLKKLKKTERKDEVKGETYRQLRRRNIIMEAVRQHR